LEGEDVVVRATRTSGTRTVQAIAADERGIALIVALLAMMLMMALGTALILTTTTETKISRNFQNSIEAGYAADAGLERAMDDLLTVPDWNTLLSGATTSAFVDGAVGTRTLADGSQVDLAQLLNMANCSKTSTCSASDLTANTSGDRPWGANNPQWQLFAYGPLNDMIPTGTVNSPFYVVVMVGDDPSDDDGNPLRDGGTPAAGQPTPNPGTGVISLRAEAFGPFGAHKVVEMTIARTDTAELERGYTGQRGQDEQNRRARKSPVQSPGKALTNTSMTLATGGIS
jgi:Tfp pilus assembly protein PilX